MKKRKFAIVGAEQRKWSNYPVAEMATKIALETIIRSHAKSDILVSGRCPKGGVDIWAEELADKYGMEKEIYPPKENNWERGYKPRNIQIAEACDILLCLEPIRVTHSGGMWTMNRAKRLGKRTELVIVEELQGMGEEEFMKLMEEEV